MELSKALATEYRDVFSRAKIVVAKESLVESVAAKILKNESSYRMVEKLTGVPWFVVACLHSMESSLSFKGVLHNGEQIIGSGKRTTLVPKGRGPFATWEASAVDALADVPDNGLKRPKTWDLAGCLWFCEQYNGWGYQTGRGQKTTPPKSSPYLWSCTDQYIKGKYVADNQFDPEAVSEQVGVGAILKSLIEKNAITFKEEVNVEAATTLADAIKALQLKGKIYDQGDVGIDVEYIQTALTTLGFTTKGIDGDYGPLTAFANGAFQKANGLYDAQNRVGPTTLGKMYELLSKATGAPAPKPAPSGSLPTQAIMRLAADISSREADKGLQWTSMQSEAEKYLAPARAAVRQPSGKFSWCACFVTWCVREAGGSIPNVLPGTGGYTIAWCPAWEAWAIKLGIWHSSRDRNFIPQKGDIVLFDWDGNPSPGDDDHIGIVISYDPKTHKITTCEGNTSGYVGGSQSNGNTTAHKVRSYALCNGFIRFPT